ncbi:polysaccharide deacetylase family protein [Biformimicrobium ophioploci]|uniref:Polysaccharide deacetylase family protein n=1 Tax=Biformimicrobium ophioploci TaxID=3036711 RepID=A0ABQ6LYZ7_9GAMM|nr:polysaccharide deacetylase family protein [Microbulbifer sp. NKW57]
MVALTFDDGPTQGKTQQILEILASHDVKSTFYLVGSAMERNPVLAELIWQAGHEIGNHSYTHSRMLFKPYDFVSDEIEKTTAIIRQSGYERNITFRPPYGKKLFVLPYYLSEAGMTSVMWDLAPDSDLPLNAEPEAIADYAIEHIQPGSIILMHVMFDARKNSMEAVPQIIEGLKEKGYRFVTVSELIEAGSSGA